MLRSYIWLVVALGSEAWAVNKECGLRSTLLKFGHTVELLKCHYHLFFYWLIVGNSVR